MGGLIGGLQILVTSEVSWFDDYFMSVDYSSLVIVLMGMSMGFGAVAGDAIKSFFKRQVGIAPGKSWVPFDQIDFVVGGLIASLPFFTLSLGQYALGVLIALVLHPTINLLAWLLRMQEKPY
jgi:CDP-2,3-bis-(O-geranylgeranyl)-sn-glycerol synthase